MFSRAVFGGNAYRAVTLGWYEFPRGSITVIKLREVQYGAQCFNLMAVTREHGSQILPLSIEQILTEH